MRRSAPLPAELYGSDMSVRCPGDNPDHHLWRNNGTWFMHFTMHLPDHTKRRVRRSLFTDNLRLARKRRDRVLSGNLKLLDIAV